MQYKSLQMFQFFKEQYKLNPVAVLEFNFEPVGADDQEKRKSSLTFVKRINTVSPSLNELYDAQVRMVSDYHEMSVMYKLGFNFHAFNALVPLYAKLEKNVKEFQRLLKKHSSHPEVVSYYKEAESHLPANVYEMMKEDFALFETVTVERMKEVKAKDSAWTMWDSEHPDWDTINRLYKEAKK
jgi:hypothetical protein